jgi:peptidoglycan/LPS O-acetylase OafA/YrhL
VLRLSVNTGMVSFVMHRSNNFDILRLILALVVVLTHCQALSLQPTLAFIPHWLDSQVAVQGFFTMSGYLILGSYDRSPSFGDYIQKRARRILPAYWVALIFVLLLGTKLTSLSDSVFWLSKDTWEFIAANLSFMNFLHPNLPGLFLSSPGEAAVNGALWTIKLEILFYLSVPVIFLLCRRYGKWQVLSFLFVLSIIYRAIVEHTHHPVLARQLPGEFCFFALGGLAYYYLGWVEQHKLVIFIVAVAAYIASLLGAGFALRAVGISGMVLCFAMFFPHIQGPTKYGDFSYGIYVFHFPIIQSLIGLGLFTASPFLSVGLVLLLATSLAVFSWNFVEKPSLGLSKPRKRIVEAVS